MHLDARYFAPPKFISTKFSADTLSQVSTPGVQSPFSTTFPSPTESLNFPNKQIRSKIWMRLSMLIDNLKRIAP